MKTAKEKTVCWVLYEKGLLDKSEIDYEVTNVAPKYNDDIALGYITLISPIVFILKRTRLFDKIVLYFVRKWMKSHKNPKKSHLIREYFVWMCETTGRFRKVVGK